MLRIVDYYCEIESCALEKSIEAETFPVRIQCNNFSWDFLWKLQIESSVEGEEANWNAVANN